MAFFGGIAHQDLRWGFTCEFCGKEAEIKTTLTEKVGENHKASSTMIGGPGARMAFEAGARNVLKQRMGKIDSEWRNGQFEAPKEADGKCPHCHKYQSWSKHVLDAQKGGKQAPSLVASVFVDLIGGAIIGAIIGAVFSFLIFTFWKSAPSFLRDPSLPATVCAALLAAYLVIGELVRGVGVAASVRALKTTDVRNQPRFISWEGEIRSHTSGSIKERV